MLSFIFKRFAGRHYRKFLERAKPVVAKINQLDESYKALSDDQLRAKTAEFKARVAAAADKNAALDELLPEAFAAVKNAARRLVGMKGIVCGQELEWNMVHFDVQLIGGMALHQGRISEMATGEGKTLVATTAMYLNALAGRNTQLVTVNDYLARRDSEWMGYLYRFLGLTVGCIQQQMPPDLRRQMYGCDITYGTASEFGFDYLRDNGMATRKEDQVQRDHWFCIVDEIDSILVDEARTPLIISGPAPIEREQPYTRLQPEVARLVGEQTRLCNRFIADAQALIKKGELTPDERHEAARRMLQVKIGHPQNKQLRALMETPEWRKLLDKTEVEYNSDFQKKELYALKEELFYSIDERQHQADLSEKGRLLLRPQNPDAFTLPDLATTFSDIERATDTTPEQKEAQRASAQEQFSQISEEIHAISQLLRAYSLYERDVQYVVAEGKVMIVDENTGRVMPGRRWSDGLHQAVEAKEGVTIERETRTYATITIQNYFRMYEKLAGMTGTAETEAAEFHDIYKLSVQVIPTNKPCIRIDKNDSIFKTRRDKYNAVLKEIVEANKKGQPVLVGTVSVEQSEVLSRMLKRSGIVHTVLNAKLHQQEAEIVARAGQRAAVTIATNMAGRGTDIKLGEGVRELGGLYVIGTERHQSRRVDRQLRGRCSRQGDPGLTKFFLSLEDELMRLFLQGNLASRMMEGSMKEGEELEHPWLNRSIESAQKKVEQQNFSQRKRLLQYDDVLNQQREVVYGIRNGALHADRAKDIIFEQVTEEVEARLETAGYANGPTAVTSAAAEGFIGWANTHFPIGLKLEDTQGKTFEAMSEFVVGKVREAYAVKESVEIPEALGAIERYIVINAIDHHWQEHLTEMESLRQSVGLRSYGQKDPLVEYKGEAYKYFQELMQNVRLQICTGLFRSASNVQVFENMLALLARNARAQGPAGTTPPMAPGVAARVTAAPRRPLPAPGSAAPGAPAPAAPTTAPKGEMPRVTAQVRTMITTSGKRQSPSPAPEGDPAPENKPDEGR